MLAFDVTSFGGLPFQDALQQARPTRTVLDAWTQINSSMTLGDLTVEVLSGNIQKASDIEAQITTLKAQLTDLRNQCQDTYGSIWDNVKRVRAGVKVIYGDNSSQFGMVGGTRAHERKSPTRNVVTA